MAGEKEGEQKPAVAPNAKEEEEEEEEEEDEVRKGRSGKRKEVRITPNKTKHTSTARIGEREPKPLRSFWVGQGSSCGAFF